MPINRNDQPGGWHLDRSVSMSHIATTVSVIIAGLWFLADQDKRIAANAQQITSVEQRIDRNEADQQRTIDRIDAKLDKLFDVIRELGNGR